MPPKKHKKQKTLDTSKLVSLGASLIPRILSKLRRLPQPSMTAGLTPTLPPVPARPGPALVDLPPVPGALPLVPVDDLTRRLFLDSHALALLRDS